MIAYKTLSSPSHTHILRLLAWEIPANRYLLLDSTQTGRPLSVNRPVLSDPKIKIRYTIDGQEWEKLVK